MVYCSFLPASSASDVGEKESASEVGGGEFRHKWWWPGPRSPLLLVSSPTLSTQPALPVPNRVTSNNKSFSDNFLNFASSGSTISETGPKNWAIPSLSTRGALLAPNARTLISIPDTGSPPLPLLRSCLSTRDLRRQPGFLKKVWSFLLKPREVDRWGEAGMFGP